ncbi:glyceraldehyde 3-phosphate reductase [Bifidobacterium ramosum]|uniref:Glyceraldehyde 3-phosphate reductase n=1 Tax=Bifidobacterium ramosum TaxID=1798158 RepID=A0A6L4WYB8_9BIFI|nr:aldo/keto reductase [Bifidobacterium ramosum]KAB8287038.1 glyceraldehyde 3-phosphate reductase [Bifidobacterium ramosum]NEG72455.1 L-glyceraldehyde 3-phosphate reductase [Bifidobacterium ramosum]
MFEPTFDYAPAATRYDSMRYNRCGTSGLKLPAISLGFWHNFGDITPYEQMKALVFTAFDHGITHFDLANNYGPEPGAAEKSAGRLIHQYFAKHRDELIVSTKAGYEMWSGPYGFGGSRKYLISSLDQSLERLGLDYVDIFYHHCPDNDTPLEETMGALAQIVASGKALYVGLSNYDGERLAKASAILDELHVPFVINQNKYNILDRTVERNGLKDTAKKLGKGLITFCPLEQGLLTDRYLNGIPADSRVAHDPRFLHEDRVESVHAKIVALNDIAQQRGQTLAEMSLAWLLRDDTVTSVLAGASKPQQILDNIGALKNTEFSDDELAAIDKIALG